MNAHQFRRVVTGVDDAGRSMVISDGCPPNVVMPNSGKGFGWADYWVLDRIPHAVTDGGDRLSGEMELEPPRGGITWKITTLPPERSLADFDGGALQAEMHELAPHMWDTGRHSEETGFHQTDTIDFVSILQGEVWLTLDEGEVLLRTGDCAIQRGTWHTWHNRGETDCVMSAVMISALALR